MDNRIFALADELKSARDRKKELEAQVKALSAQVEQLDQELSEAMTEAECDKFSHSGMTFYLKNRLFASPKAGRKAEMMQALKDNGYGELVTETVNANTLSSFLGEMDVVTEEDLPNWLSGKVGVYQKTSVGVRRS